MEKDFDGDKTFLGDKSIASVRVYVMIKAVSNVSQILPQIISSLILIEPYRSYTCHIIRSFAWNCDSIWFNVYNGFSFINLLLTSPKLENMVSTFWELIWRHAIIKN